MSWFGQLSELQRGVIVYGGVILAWLCCFELPAKDVLGWAPWPSTTATVRDAIQWWHPVALMVVVLFYVLYGHFDRGWGVSYLIATAALIIAAVLLHYFVPKV